MSQLEIFKKDDTLFKSQRKDPHFLKKLFSYERTIIFIIIFLVINIVSFSLGVEKGKRLVKISNPPTQKIMDVNLRKQISPNNLNNNAITSPIEKEEAKTIQQEEPKDKIAPITNYTIQIASFSNKTHVQKELGALKNKGYSVFTLAKGNMTIICVGKFKDKEKAKNLAGQLKKKYRDCLVRRL